MILWMIYDEKDYKNNNEYVKWFEEEGKILGIEVKLILRNELDILISNKGHEFLYAGRLISKPEAAINRTRDWKIANILENANVRVFNNSKINMLANDKLLSYSKASSLGLKVMYTDTVMYIEENYIYKSRSGHGGNEVYYSNDENIKKLRDIVNEDYLRQSISSVVGKDLRVYIMAGEILISILRSSELDFRSNYKLGGKVRQYHLNDKQKETVMKIVDTMELDYVGIDFLFDEEENLIFNEIEDPVGSRMVSKVAPEINIAQKFLTHIKNSIQVE